MHTHPHTQTNARMHKHIYQVFSHKYTSNNFFRLLLAYFYLYFSLFIFSMLHIFYSCSFFYFLRPNVMFKSTPYFSPSEAFSNADKRTRDLFIYRRCVRLNWHVCWSVGISGLPSQHTSLRCKVSKPPGFDVIRWLIVSGFVLTNLI